jgi:hypothetical protein
VFDNLLEKLTDVRKSIPYVYHNSGAVNGWAPMTSTRAPLFHHHVAFTGPEAPSSLLFRAFREDSLCRCAGLHYWSLATDLVSSPSPFPRGWSFQARSQRLYLFGNKSPSWCYQGATQNCLIRIKDAPISLITQESPRGLTSLLCFQWANLRNGACWVNNDLLGTGTGAEDLYFLFLDVWHSNRVVSLLSLKVPRDAK